MHAIATRFMNTRALVAVLAAAALFTATAANAAPINYVTSLSGANESPPNASPGTGTATLVHPGIQRLLKPGRLAVL